MTDDYALRQIEIVLKGNVADSTKLRFHSRRRGENRGL
jgi:hypothetical protein